MCDISVGMYNIGEEAGVAKGLLQGEERGLKKGLLQGESIGKQDEQKHSIRNLLTLGQSVEQIIQIFQYPESLVYEVAKEQHV